MAAILNTKLMNSFYFKNDKNDYKWKKKAIYFFKYTHLNINLKIIILHLVFKRIIEISY